MKKFEVCWKRKPHRQLGFFQHLSKETGHKNLVMLARIKGLMHCFNQKIRIKDQLCDLFKFPLQYRATDSHAFQIC